MLGIRTCKCGFSSGTAVPICLHGQYLPVVKALSPQESWVSVFEVTDIVIKCDSVLSFDILSKCKSRISEMLSPLCICGLLGFFFKLIYAHSIQSYEW